MPAQTPSETVDTQFQDGVAIIGFSSQIDGMITGKGADLLADAVEAALADPAVRSIVITGSALGVFIRHAEVGQISRAAQALEQGLTDEQAFLSSPFQRLGQLLDAARKPVIAAINGVCMGGGFEIALACTLRVVGADVQSIGLPEIRIDIFPGAGGTQRLARLMGRHKARIFILEGRVVDAATAHGLGIVDHVAKDPLARSLELAKSFAARTPEAIAAVMELTRFDDAEGLGAEALAFARNLTVPGVRERLDRFNDEAQRLDEIP